ncbi:MAG: DUF2017 family protein [Acidimicrobiia bacterium]
MIKKLRGGKGISILLDVQVVDLLTAILSEHEDWLHTPAIGPDGNVDPAHQRIYPRAYLDPTEDEAEAHWQSHVHADMAAEKLGAVGLMRRALEAAPNERRGTKIDISYEDLDRWCKVVNEVRLRLGSQLDISEEEQFLDVGPDHPQWESVYRYHLMSEFLDMLVTASMKQSDPRTR